MEREEILFLVLSLLLCWSNCQRVAPGVPPQHYQQAPVQHQQYQQQINLHGPQDVPSSATPLQYQKHAQVQHQQLPPQQHYEQNIQHIPQVQMQQQQQTNVHRSTQGQPKQLLNVGNLDHERVHIQEHIQVPIDTSKMTDAELQFHYFKIHDSDNNNQLDGCELIKSLIHWHEQGSKEPHSEQATRVEEKIFSDEELVALIDPILQMDDISRDGYIDYPEFIKAQQKAAASTSQHKQQPGQ